MKKVGVFTSMIFGLGAAYSTAATFRGGVLLKTSTNCPQRPASSRKESRT